jgi:sodium-coupled neutral amino acid transporter 11
LGIPLIQNPVFLILHSFHQPTTDKSLRLLIEQASFHPSLHHLPIHTFEDLASYPFGKFGSGFVLFNMFIMAYGAMVAYLLIIKDTVPTVLGYEHGTHLLERNLILIATSLLVMVPLSMQRDMASLSFTSAISVFADVILVVFIAAFSPIKESIENAGGFGQVLKNDGINSTLFIGLGILSTAMACQHSAFIVANSLENKTRQRWRWVTNQSIGLSAILCAILGICGYLGFLGETQGDVLNNFSLDSLEANAARVLLAFTMLFTYPMESFVARHVLIMLIHNGDMDARGGFTLENESRVEEEELGEDAGRDEGTVHTTGTNRTTGSVVEGGGLLCMNRRQTWTVTVYLMTLIPALIFSDIGPVLSLTGAVGGSCISYIGPGLVYLGVNGEAFLVRLGDWVEHWRRAKGYSTSNGAGTTTNDQDLPVDGIASLGAVEADFRKSYETIISGPRPLWYYLGFFPVWCYIANNGATHMEKKIDDANAATGLMANSGGAANDDSKAALLSPPAKSDFGVSLFFVLFGVVSAVAGVVSNVYVQWNDLDEVEVDGE